MKIIIVNGPNLNLTGVREPKIYGLTNFNDLLVMLKQKYPNMHIDYYQSNVEGELINKLHEVMHTHEGIILNAGGYTHTSVAIADAVAAIQIPVVEVHLSNILAREAYRKESYISKHAKGVITGFGLISYELALLYFGLNQIQK
jgi:3-dehydroquinate dehydratase-2